MHDWDYARLQVPHGLGNLHAAVGTGHEAVGNSDETIRSVLKAAWKQQCQSGWTTNGGLRVLTPATASCKWNAPVERLRKLHRMVGK